MGDDCEGDEGDEGEDDVDEDILLQFSKKNVVFFDA